MTTLQDLIGETRQHLMTEHPDRINVLQNSVAADANVLQLSYAGAGVAAGARLCVDLEIYHVVEDPTSSSPGTNISVIPGTNGSTSAAHTAGTLVYVNPDFSDFRIAQQLNHCLKALEGHGLFWVNSLQFDYSPAISGYDLVASDFIDIWRLSHDQSGSANNWPTIPPRFYEVDNAADLTEFPSGRQLVLKSAGSSGRPVKVSYRARFSPFDLDPFDPDADVTTLTHLHNSAHDIPPLGAAIRCMFGGEIKRNLLTKQPEPRRSEEVPPGAVLGSVRNLAIAYYEAIDREMRVLAKRYPNRTGG
jgi:hypothetical protein